MTDEVSDDHIDESDELRSFFGEHQDSVVVDVREMHETRFFSDWESCGLSATPENVPMTRFTEFIARTLERHAAGDDQDVIFICRSGTRSARAASVLRRLGVAGAFHVAGGLAACRPGLPEPSRFARSA